MKVRLTKLHPEFVKGIYTVSGIKNRMPERTLYLAPDAADSFLTHLASLVTVSDIYRTAESSLAAVLAGRGAMPPGYSGHNFGLSIDISVDALIKTMGFKSKVELDSWMEARGWYCHRRDHTRGKEDWHFNYLGVGATISPKVRSTSGYVEAEIVKRYGTQFKLTNKEAQLCLAKLGMYGGAIDGRFGPLSEAAVSAFQRAWNLSYTGALDSDCQRTLAFVAADKELI